jgi:hypothetical protein
MFTSIHSQTAGIWRRTDAAHIDTGQSRSPIHRVGLQNPWKKRHYYVSTSSGTDVADAPDPVQLLRIHRWAPGRYHIEPTATNL